jgi:hypothetical protein
MSPYKVRWAFKARVTSVVKVMPHSGNNSLNSYGTKTVAGVLVHVYL